MKNHLTAAALLCFVFNLSYAQPGALDLSFDPGTGANGQVRATAVQTDGKVIIAGNFTDYNGNPAPLTARLLSTGAFDTSYHTGTGPNAIVYACALQTDGKLVIAGDFTAYNGTACNYVARINTDGTFDTGFNTGSGLNGSVRSLLIQPDGKIVLGGNFTSCNGSTRNRICRLLTTGAVDGTFNPGGGANGTVEAMARQADGKIVIGGSFTSFGNNILLRLGRVNADGSADNGFNTFLGGASSTVFAVAVQSDQHILIGGNFVNYNGSPANRITRLGTSGGLDNSFSAGSGANSSVYVIKELADGKILVGGNFTSYNGSAIGRIMRLATDGSVDPLFVPGAGAQAEILSISVQSDNKLIIGGSFTDYDNVSRNRVARLNTCVTPQPGNISGRVIMCPGTVETYSIPPVQDADYYTWTLPVGWSGSSDSTSIVATSNGSGGTIVVTAHSAACGTSLPTTLNVTAVPVPAVPICLVTVDTPSTHNIVIWEKPLTSTIDSFFIYRETTTNVYTKITAVPYDSLSEYHDYAADPNTTSYKYKISTLDTCGVESDRSDYHNTIHLQYLSNGNLQWTLYGIENASNPVNFYNIYRDDLGNGNFAPISTTIPGNNTSFSDPDFLSFPNAIYVMDASWNISCTPTRAISTTRSNIRHLVVQEDTTHTGTGPDLNEFLAIYPNPASKQITIANQLTDKITTVTILNMQGQQILKKSETEGAHMGSREVIDISELPRGIYTVHIATAKGRAIKKLVIQ